MDEEENKLTNTANEDVSSSSSDDDDDDDDVDQELINRAEELEKEISANKYLYDAHVEIVNIYRKLSDLNSMRAAYRRFHEYFPLTPNIWLDWLRDEIKIASLPTEQKLVFDLFDKSVEDYLSVELWIEYAQYSIGVNDLQTTRSILERGLTAAGLHTSEGSLLWDTLRELEHAHLCLMAEDSEEWKSQIGVLNDVFKRQLSVPLLNMENTFHEWQEWFNKVPNGIIDSGPVEWGYKQAIKKLEMYKPFEEKLLIVKNNEALYEVYKDYIKITDDPSFTLCLYERAAVTLCLIPNFWVDYCTYGFKLGEEASIKISNKALRNCPWSEELWIKRLRSLEHFNKEENEILACFEQGISSIYPNPGLELWLCYLEYIHRNNVDVERLDKLFSQGIQQVGFDNDPSCKLSRWHARILAKRGDMSTARKIWNNILHQQQNKGTASVWLEYANLERQYGEPSQLRTLFRRALSVCTDWPQCISEEWLMYEREFGTLEQVLKCIEKCKTVAKVPQDTECNVNIPVQDQQGTKRKRDRDDTDFKNKKSKFPFVNTITRDKKELSPHNIRKQINKDPKTTVFVSNLHPSVGEEELKELFPNALQISIILDRKGKSRCYGYIEFSKEEEVMTALARDRTPLDGRPVFISEIKPEKTERKPAFNYAVATEANKLFVRGLPTTKSKEEVEEIFKPYEPKDVRLVFRKNGQSKGLAYIEFENTDAAQKALKEMDQKKIDDHIITVAISAPPPKKVTNVAIKEPVRHARSRLQVPMIPRTLQIKKPEKDTSINGSGAYSTTAKSNADFRNMLLKK